MKSFGHGGHGGNTEVTASSFDSRLTIDDSRSRERLRKMTWHSDRNLFKFIHDSRFTIDDSRLTIDVLIVCQPKIMTAELRIIQHGIYVGKEAALSSLHRLFHRRLFNFSKSITRSAEDSEEIVEDVFVKLWTNRSQLNEIENLQVYLYVAVKNHSLNLIAKKARNAIFESFDDLDIDLSALSADPHKLLVTTEMMQRMQKVVDTLPPRCKMIFRLVREDGLPYKEVAQILNISVNTIDVQMAIAIKKICTALQSDGIPASFFVRPAR